MIMKNDPHTALGKQWQFYLRGINYNMTIENVSLLIDFRLAFANRTGLTNPKDPRADYLLEKNLGYASPQLDKVRTTSRSVLTGVEQGDYLKVDVFDSRLLPPLKPGRSYPLRVVDINPDDYLYLPEFNPEKFLIANIVNNAGEVVQFPRGALYPWTGDQTIYSFLPHIANLAYGPILVPLKNLYKVPLGSPKPSPYRHNE